MARMTLEQFSDRLGEIMPRMMREFLRHESAEFYRMKVTLPQFLVMNILYTNGESRMSDLAGYVNVTTAAMTGLADRLVRDGYARRMADPKDRRIVRAALTVKGTMIVKRMLEQRKRIIMKMFSVVSHAEREEYLRILANIEERLKNE